MQGMHKAHSCEQDWGDFENLVVGIHPALGEVLDGLDMAIKAVGELERLPRRETGSVVDRAVNYGKLLRNMRDGLQRVMPTELVDVDVLWEISFGATSRNGIVEA